MLFYSANERVMMLQKFQVPVGTVHRHNFVPRSEDSRVIIISGKKATPRERLSREVPCAKHAGVRGSRAIISLHALCSFPDSNTRRMLRDEVGGLTLSDGRDDG